MLPCASQASCRLPPSFLIPFLSTHPASLLPPSFLLPFLSTHPASCFYLGGRGLWIASCIQKSRELDQMTCPGSPPASKVENITRGLLCEMVRCNGETIPKSLSHSVYLSISVDRRTQKENNKTTRACHYRCPQP